MDAMIGRLAHRVCRRLVTFTEPIQPVPLPRPDLKRIYLLYLHVPYCFTLCPFCSFHRVRFDEADAGSYFDCLRDDVRKVTAAGYVFDELYVGGGTPTVLPDDLLATLRLARELHPLRSISVETNPDDLGKDKVMRLRELDVDRLSVGVQSFDDKLLEEMERIDRYGNGATIMRRLEDSKDRFPTLNVDMIFNLPHQTEASLARDLDILIDEIGIDQVSWYPLMAAEGTKVSMRRRMGAVDYSRERAYYELIAGRLQAAGYRRSSAWCFSRTQGLSDEYIAEREEYLGLGSGAFSYIDGALYATTFSIPTYRDRVRNGQTGIERRRQLSPREQKRYYLLMRLFGGRLDIPSAEERFAGTFQKGLRRELALLRGLGAITEEGGEFTLTEAGHYVWVVLMREFFSAIDHLRDEMRISARAKADR